ASRNRRPSTRRSTSARQNPPPSSSLPGSSGRRSSPATPSDTPAIHLIPTTSKNASPTWTGPPTCSASAPPPRSLKCSTSSSLGLSSRSSMETYEIADCRLKIADLKRWVPDYVLGDQSDRRRDERADEGICQTSHLLVPATAEHGGVSADREA